jgi:ankyrin repeat protein
VLNIFLKDFFVTIELVLQKMEKWEMKRLKTSIVCGLILIFTCTSFLMLNSQRVEAGLLGDLIDIISNSTHKGKTTKRNSATQIDKILHNAVKDNDYDMAIDAIERGANVNSMYENMFPLERALYFVGWPHYDTRMADLLIQHGADIEGWYDVTDNKSHYYAFTSLGGTDGVLYLLNKGLNVNLKNENGISLLMYCVVSTAIEGRVTHSELIQELVNRGADVNIKAKRDDGINSTSCYVYSKGGTALMAAAYLGQVEIARILLYAGADKDIRNDQGETALDIAISRGNNDMTKLLLNWNEDNVN